jgi:hypothetical protein
MLDECAIDEIGGACPLRASQIAFGRDAHLA